VRERKGGRERERGERERRHKGDEEGKEIMDVVVMVPENLRGQIYPGISRWPIF
jgi:hypothetical protein